MKRITAGVFAVLVLGSVILLSSGCDRICRGGSLEERFSTINVQGEGKVEAVPDEALARFGVASDEKTLSKAYSDNSRKMNGVIAAIKKKGVPAEDITTSSYAVTPVYPLDENGRQLPGKPGSFRVNQELTVKIRDAAKTGEIIDEVLTAGANTFSGIQFTSGKMDDLETEARVKAAKDAGHKAAILAEALNVKLGRILRVNQSSNRPYPVNRMMAYDMSMARSVPQIEAGTMEVTATCDVTYEIVQ